MARVGDVPLLSDARATRPGSSLSLFVITAPGLERVTAGELAALGLAPDEIEPGGITVRGTPDQLQSANLHLRTASRVLVRVAEFRATSFAELERLAARVPWERFVAPGGAARFRVTCRKSRLYHSDAVAERLARALVARVPGAAVATARGGEDEEAPAPADAAVPLPPQLFVVRLFHDRLTLSADSSGELLHRRGYRQAVARAPLRETIAAAMLLASGWEAGAPLVDPFCGSGTIPIEAALLARRIAPGIRRRFAFMAWPDFDAARWARLVARAREAELPAAPAPIAGSDRDAGAIAAAHANAERAGVAADVAFTQRALSSVEPPAAATTLAPGWLVTNPPYGVRLGERGALRDLWARLGDVARTRFPGWTLALLSPDPRLAAQLRLAMRDQFATSNGGVRVRLLVGREG